MSFFKHESAYVDEGAVIGTDTKIWHFSHVQAGATIGDRCILGQNVNIASGVEIGNGVKIQNNVSVYTGTIVEDFAFLGPSCVFTNVTNPRSEINRHSLYEPIRIRRGATLGANCTVVPGVTIGRYAFVAAGAIVTRDVPDYGFVVGCPARLKGYMSRHGHLLAGLDSVGEDMILVCPESGLRYRFDRDGKLRCLDLDEDVPLPKQLAAGNGTYDDWKQRG